MTPGKFNNASSPEIKVANPKKRQSIGSESDEEAREVAQINASSAKKRMEGLEFPELLKHPPEEPAGDTGGY